MRLSELVAAKEAFEPRIHAIRDGTPEVDWYPWGSLYNVDRVSTFLPSSTEIVNGRGSVLDIGAADGELGLLFHSLGCDVDMLDNPPTNFNNCQGLRAYASALDFDGRIIEADMDWGLSLDRDYDLALFLGTAYHLRNPALTLMTLAQHCSTMLFSTRVFSRTPDGADVSAWPISYLIEAGELGGDPTNYWVMTAECCFRLLTRCGWRVLQSRVFGDLGQADPVRTDFDERLYALCKRDSNYSQMKDHHEF
jgi:tRNA (mo5U34)-methyltransferase